MLPDRHARPYRAPSFSPVLLARSASSPEPQLPQSRMPPAAALPAGPFSLAAQPSGARAADATPDADAAAAAAASLASGKLPRSVALDDQFDLLQFLAAAAPSDQAVPALTPTTPAGPAAAFGFLAAEPMPSLLTPASLRSPAFTPQASAVMLPHLLDAIASTLPPDAWDWASTEVDPAGREDGLDGRAAADESKPTLTIENVLTKDKRGTISPCLPARRCCVVFNLYETEQSYANQLGIIQKASHRGGGGGGGGVMFRKGLTDRGIISDTAVNLIFGGTEELYQLHLRFFERLSNIVSVENWSTTESRIGGLFLEMKDEFVRLYTRFIDNYAISQKSMKKEEKANEDYQNFMKEMSKLRETNRQMLKEFLILPVQRTTRYHLLLKDLLKQTPQEHPDRPDLEQAWEAMNNLAAMVNEKKRKEEEATGLFDAFEATKNCPPQLISHKRRLIMRVDANERTSKRDVQLVLCSDSLMITMPTRTGVLGFARAVTEYPFKFVRWHHLMEIEINDPPGDDAGSGRDVLRITIDINKRPPDPDPQVVSTQTSDVTPKELGISQMQLVFIGPDAAKNRLSFRLAINGEMKALREARSNAAANAGAAGMSQGNIFNQADA
nr:Protein T2 [Polyrhizophydium stewartii]